MRQTFPFIRACLIGFALLTASSVSAEYPERPIRLLVGFPPGGSSDFVARNLATELSDRLNQQIIVENRTGAGGNIAAAEVSKASPDGYTILLGDTGTLVYNKALYQSLTYDPDADLQPLALVAQTPMFVVVNKDFPAANMKELIADAQKGSVAFASAGVGNPTHLALEFLKSALKIDLMHVPYRGTGPALTDVIGGQVAGVIIGSSGALPHLESGRVKVLAVLANERSRDMPTVPTLEEATGVALDATGWMAIAVPKSVPEAAKNRLRDAVRDSVESPRFTEALSKAGAVAARSTNEEFSKLLSDERTRRQQVEKLGISVN